MKQNYAEVKARGSGKEVLIRTMIVYLMT